MSFKGKKKKIRLFTTVFRCLTPAEFLSFFEKEYTQTMAFILSFAQNRRYVRKVIELIGDEKICKQLISYLDIRNGRTSFREYQKKLSTNIEFIKHIEKTVLETINQPNSN